MTPNSGTQEIAIEAAKVIVQQFLQTLPDELVNALPEGSLDDLTTDLQDDLRSCVHSRLQWTTQSALAVILEQQRQRQHEETASHLNLVNLQPLQKLPQKESTKSHQPRSLGEKALPVIERTLAEEKPFDLNSPIQVEPAQEDYWGQLLLNKSVNRKRKRRGRSVS